MSTETHSTKHTRPYRKPHGKSRHGTLGSTPKMAAALDFRLMPGARTIAIGAAPFNDDPLPPDEDAVAAMLAPSKAEKAATAIAAERAAEARYDVGAYAGSSARSGEARSDEQHPLAAPAAAKLESAVELATIGPDDRDLDYVEKAAFDIFCQLGTLADRFPRTARRTERGHWARAGVVNDTLDAACATYERRWERADVDADRALRKYHDAERAQKGGEIDAVELQRCEDDAVEANDKAQFYRALLDAARRTYELLIGEPWITRAKMRAERAIALELANARLSTVSVYTPPKPAATQRVVVMGGSYGWDLVEAALDKVFAKYPALTLYSGDREFGIERYVARWAMGKCQLVRFGLDRDRDGRAAPFRRAERMLADAQPHGLIVCGELEHGPTAHLVNIARQRGIKIWDLRQAPDQTEKAPAVAPGEPGREALASAA